MDVIDAIYSRRSIRKYLEKPVPRDIVEKVIAAGIQAPSAKNRQPWRFIVFSGDAKNEMLAVMEEGLRDEADGKGILKKSAQYLSGAENTLRIMKQAPVTIFILNTGGHNLFEPLDAESKIYEIADIESVSAAIQNMSLAAVELGLGSLWICDTYFAYQKLSNWLNTDGEMIAALALGYPDEQPCTRPRKSLDDVVEWRH